MSNENKIKITVDGLRLLTTVCHGCSFDGVYGKEVYFTKGFEGDVTYLFQVLGILGAFGRDSRFGEDVDIVVLSDRIVEDGDPKLLKEFIDLFEDQLNKANNATRRMKFITESQIMNFFSRRANNATDTSLNNVLRMYRQSIKSTGKEQSENNDNTDQLSLF